MQICDSSLDKAVIQLTKSKIMSKDSGTSSAIYGLGLIGAAIYFISGATSFWMGIIGFLKALVWPAFMVYELLKYVGA